MPIRKIWKKNKIEPSKKITPYAVHKLGWSNYLCSASGSNEDGHTPIDWLMSFAPQIFPNLFPSRQKNKNYS